MNVIQLNRLSLNAITLNSIGAASTKKVELPADYARLSGVIMHDDTYYTIDGFRLRGSDTVKVSFTANKACNVIGSYTTSSAEDNYSIFASTSSGAKYLRYNGGTYFSHIEVGKRYDIIITPTGCTGFDKESTWEQKDFTTSTDMLIGTTSVGATSAKLDGVIHGSIEVVGRAKFIPCRRLSDGVIGYYDTYSKLFYTPTIGTPEAPEADTPTEPDAPSNPEVDENGYIIFKDAEVARICAENWGDGTGITLEQAAAVTHLDSKFRNNKVITSFDELRFFTKPAYIYSYEFEFCSSLASVILPESIVGIQKNAFYACAALKTVQGAGNVVSIGSDAFRRCSSLVSLPLVNIESIGTRAFYECKALESLGDLRKVKTIGEVAFDNCDSLNSMFLESVTKIDGQAFSNCNNFTSIVINKSTPPTLGASAFVNSPTLIYVPDASVNTYREATNWNTYASSIFPISQLATDNPSYYEDIKNYL